METFHALHYNILSATGNIFGYGDVTPELATKYSDAWIDDSVTPNIIRNLDGDELFVKNDTSDCPINEAIQNGLYNVHSYGKGVFSEEEAMAANNQLSLFGMSMLPWNRVSIQDREGNWVYLHSWGDAKAYKPMLNPLRREVLMDKVITMGKIAIAGGVVWYGGKYAMKKLK